MTVGMTTPLVQRVFPVPRLGPRDDPLQAALSYCGIQLRGVSLFVVAQVLLAQPPHTGARSPSSTAKDFINTFLNYQDALLSILQLFFGVR